jgi:DNA uptake protein ComE-like DNA-binding protein
MAGTRSLMLAAVALTLVALPLRAGPPRYIDLNHATLEELLEFKGIGRIYADKIIRGRPYRTRSELVQRNILPAEAYLAIKGQLYASPMEDGNGRSRYREPFPAGGIDLNRASRDELTEFPGIGEAYADKIIRGRPYAQSLELVGRHVMPLGAYEKIANRLYAVR